MTAGPVTRPRSQRTRHAASSALPSRMRGGRDMPLRRSRSRLPTTGTSIVSTSAVQPVAAARSTSPADHRLVLPQVELEPQRPRRLRRRSPRGGAPTPSTRRTPCPPRRRRAAAASSPSGCTTVARPAGASRNGRSTRWPSTVVDTSRPPTSARKRGSKRTASKASRLACSVNSPSAPPVHEVVDHPREPAPRPTAQIVDRVDRRQLRPDTSMLQVVHRYSSVGRARCADVVEHAGDSATARSSGTANAVPIGDVQQVGEHGVDLEAATRLSRLCSIDTRVGGLPGGDHRARRWRRAHRAHRRATRSSGCPACSGPGRSTSVAPAASATAAASATRS